MEATCQVSHNTLTLDIDYAKIQTKQTIYSTSYKNIIHLFVCLFSSMQENQVYFHGKEEANLKTNIIFFLGKSNIIFTKLTFN